MKKSVLIILLSIVIFFTSSCDLLNTSAPPPQLSATDIVPKATAMSELPPTWTPEPTLTPTSTSPPSPTPTATLDPSLYNISAQMTPVAIAYPSVGVDTTGWTRIEGKTALISIPPSYEVLDFANVFIEMMFGVMEAFTEGFIEFAEEIGEELGVTPEATLEEPDFSEMPEIDFILAIEETSQSAIFFINVDREPDTTTEIIINQALMDTETDFQLSTREVLTDGPYPIERIILDIEDEELGAGKQIIYVILGETTAWNIVFSTPLSLFDQNLPIYESVILSFSPVP